jgi:small subunit ribosomal protein S17
MPKRILEGQVVSDKGDKTVVVKVERTFLHPVLKKTVRRSKKYHAHDEANAYHTGETVRIQECPPRSKLKAWEVLNRVGAEIAPAPKAKTKAQRAAKKAAPAEAAPAPEAPAEEASA